MIDGYSLLIAAVCGALIGSFLNVCIYRLPRRESIVWPGSHCPSCGAPIAWYDNVPVLSYLWLLGRCRAKRGRGVSSANRGVLDSASLQWPELFARHPRVVDYLLVPATPEPHISYNRHGTTLFRNLSHRRECFRDSHRHSRAVHRALGEERHGLANGSVACD